MRTQLLLPLLLTAPVFGQASEDFENGNPDNWGVEFHTPAGHHTTGGNPDGRIEATMANTASILPAATLLPEAPGHPWAGNFRAIDVASFSYDREVLSGSSNFGTFPNILLGSDNGTRTDFLDDTWIFVQTSDFFQFGPEPWATVTTPIPSLSAGLPANWGAAALPNSPIAGATDDDIWNFVIVDVDYVGIAMGRPFNGGAWFGSHVISWDNFILDVGSGQVGTSYCGPAVPNSSTQAGTITASGSVSVLANNLSLTADNLPAGEFGYFLTGQVQGFFNPPGSQGFICLSGNIGRYNGAGDIIQGPTGSLSLDLDSMPVNPPAAVLAGETWNFQCWFRDSNPGPTSNFTDGLTITFQ